MEKDRNGTTVSGEKALQQQCPVIETRSRARLGEAARITGVIPQLPRRAAKRAIALRLTDNEQPLRR